MFWSAFRQTILSSFRNQIIRLRDIVPYGPLTIWRTLLLFVEHSYYLANTLTIWRTVDSNFHGFAQTARRS